MKKVIILTEGGVKYGLGHISRCSALYDALEESGFSPLMIINGDDSLKKKVSDKNVLFTDWIKTGNRRPIIHNVEIAVVDSYLASEDVCNYFSDKFKLTVFLDDNIRIKYPKGIVINGALFAEQMNYPQENGIEYLLGNNFILLQKPFWSVPSKKIANKIENILITMGGSDAGNLTAKIVHWLRESFPTVKINIPAGINFKIHDELEKQINGSINLIYNAGADEMKDLMNKADIAISSAGQTLFELARMGVPIIAIQTAENQKYNIDGWNKTGFIEYAGNWNDKNLLEKILNGFNNLLDIEQRQIKSEIGQKWIDGKGAGRVSKKIMQHYFEKNMFLRKAVSADVKKIYQLSNDDDVRKNSFSLEKIEFSQHKRWFSQKINSENCLFLIAENKQEMIGQIRFDIEKDAIISISIHRNYRNMGIGNLMMKKALQFLKNSYPAIRKVVAFVKEDNIASKKYFEKCNYIYINFQRINNFASSEYHYYFEKTT